MADTDEDWANFMNSIDEPDDEVETDDDDVSEDEPEAGKPDKSDKVPPKKSTEAPKGGQDDDETDKPKGKPAADAKAEDADKPKDGKSDTYEPRLKQFLNDDGSLDPERIEKSYIETSKEAVRLNNLLEETNEKYDRLLETIKGKPDVAKELFGEDGAKSLAAGQPEGQPKLDPYVSHVKAQLDKQSKKEYAEFVEAHPESVTDPEKIQKIGKFLKRFGRDYAEDNDGELPTMKTGLEAAYRYYGWELEISNKEDVVNAVRDTAATRRTPNKKTPAPKQNTNQLEGYFAKKLGVKLK